MLQMAIGTISNSFMCTKSSCALVEDCAAETFVPALQVSNFKTSYALLVCELAIRAKFGLDEGTHNSQWTVSDKGFYFYIAYTVLNCRLINKVKPSSHRLPENWHWPAIHAALTQSKSTYPPRNSKQQFKMANIFIIQVAFKCQCLTFL